MRLEFLGSALSVWMAVTLPPAFSADDDVVIRDRPEKPTAVNNRQGEILGGSAQANASTLRPHLDYALMSQIGKVDAECALTVEQVRKLQLAGRGDIQRIMGELFRIEAESTARAERGVVNVNMQWEIRRRVLAPAMAPFAENSLFHKVLWKMLTMEQQGQLRNLEEAEDRTLTRAHLGAIYGLKCPLNEDQEASIARLFRSRYPEWRPGPAGAMSVSVVVLMAAELGEELKPLLTDEQWQQTVAFVKTAEQREPLLRDYGLWPIRAAGADGKSP